MKIGLVLSGGGSRGVAHLGALKALETLGVKPHMVSGVSAGAIAGSFYCAGVTPEMTLSIIQKLRIFSLLKFAWGKLGFVSLEGAEKLYSEYLPQTFEELKIPLHIAATDFGAAETKYFSSGPLLKTISASSCIPVLFKPVEINGRLYVDGGLLNNMPIEPIQKECDVVIGVHCNPNDEQYGFDGLKSMAERCFDMAVYSNTPPRLRQCDILIEPEPLKKYSMFDITKAKEMYDHGFVAVFEKEKEILSLLNRRVAS